MFGGSLLSSLSHLLHVLSSVHIISDITFIDEQHRCVYKTWISNTSLEMQWSERLVSSCCADLVD